MSTLWERLAGLNVNDPGYEGTLEIPHVQHMARFTKAGLIPVEDVGPYFALSPEHVEAWDDDFLVHIPAGILGYAWIDWLGHVLTQSQAGLPALDTEAKVKAAMGIAPP